MVRSPASDIAGYLAGRAGLGPLHGTSDWSVHVSSEPARSPVNVVTVYDTTGAEPDTDELDEYRPSLQVRVRSLDYQEAYSRQRAIRDLLIRGEVECETSVFQLIVLSSDILPIGQDESDRHILTANYRCRRTEKEL